MPEIVLKDTLWQVCLALELVYELALTERLDPDPVDWRAGDLEYRVEHGLSDAKLEKQKLHVYGTTLEILFRVRQHKLMRLFNQRYMPADPGYGGLLAVVASTRSPGAGPGKPYL